MFMQRVIDPSRISELTAMAADAGGRDFTIGQIGSHLKNAETALDDTGVDAASIVGLMSLAHEIGDVNQIADFAVSGG